MSNLILCLTSLLVGMSDESDEEFSSLYKSIKRKNIPNVRKISKKKKKFQSILKNSRDRNASTSDTYLENSSKHTTSNEDLNTSQTIPQSHVPNKFILRSRRRKSNVFANILNKSVLEAKNLQNSAPAGHTKNQEIKSQNSINSVTRNVSLNSTPLDSNDSKKFLEIHHSQENLLSRKPFLRSGVQIKKYTRAQVHSFANAFSSDSSISEHHNILHKTSIDPSSSIESPKVSNFSHSSKSRAQNLNSKVRRNRELLENILNPPGQSHSNEIIDSKLTSNEDNIDLSIARNKFQKKKSKKSNLIYGNILTSNLSSKNNQEVFSAISSASLKRNENIIHDKTASSRHDYENEVSSQLTEQNNKNFTSTFHSKRSQSNIDNYFSKLKKSLIHNSNLYGNNHEVLESNILGSNMKSNGPSLVTEHSEGNDTNFKFKVPTHSIENHVNKGNKSYNVKKLEMPTTEKKITSRDYASSPTTNPESLVVNVNSRTLHSQKNVFDTESSSSDLTFDSALVLHSTLRNTPILKPHKNTVPRNNAMHEPRNLMYESHTERYSKNSENSTSTSDKHNRLLVKGESGSHGQDKPDESEKKHPSDLSKVQNQSENDKIYKFARSNNSLSNQQAEDRSNSQLHLVSKIQHRTSLEQSVAYDIHNNKEGVLSNVSESKRKLKEMAKNHKIDVLTSRHNYESSSSESDSLKFNFDKFKRLSHPNKLRKKTRSQENDTVLNLNPGVPALSLNHQSVSSRSLDNSKRILSDVSERLKDRANNDKIVPTSRHNDDSSYGDGESELPVFNFDINKRNSQSKLNEKLPANKMKRSQKNDTVLNLNPGVPALSLNHQSVSSRSLDNSKRILSDVSERLKDRANNDKIVPTSRHNDDSSYGDGESELPVFNFDINKRNSQSKLNEKLPANKMKRSQKNDTVLNLNPGVPALSLNHQSVSSRSLHNSKRILSDVSERLKDRANNDKIVPTSRHNDDSSYGDGESELLVFNFDINKRNSQSKLNEKLPANKMKRSRKNDTVLNLNPGVPALSLNQGDEPRSKYAPKSRKFVVRGKTMPFKKPAEWVNNRLYNKLIPFFETKFGPLKCYSVCENMTIDLCNNVKKALKKPKEQVICVNNVRKTLYNVGVIKTPMDFMLFADQYLPNDFNLIAIPKKIGSCVLGVPYPKGIGLFDDLKLC